MELVEVAQEYLSKTFMNEDHRNALVKEFDVASADLNSFRDRVKNIVSRSYPDSLEEFVDVFGLVDSAFSEVIKLVNKL